MVDVLSYYKMLMLQFSNGGSSVTIFVVTIDSWWMFDTYKASMKIQHMNSQRSHKIELQVRCP
jgi:hypothetical protein